MIVGGGPAGAACATIIARAGATVCVIQRAAVAKGVELISGRVRRILESDLELTPWTKCPTLEITETVSLWGDVRSQQWSALLDPYGAGLAVERDRFDCALQDDAGRAGATVINGSVVRVTREGGRWQIALDDREGTRRLIGAEWLVIATGRSGGPLIRRSFVSTPRLAFTARIPTSLEGKRHQFRLELVRNGWWYAIPSPLGGTFLGFCTNGSLHRGWRSLPAGFCAELEATKLMRDLVRPKGESLAVQGRGAGSRIPDAVRGPGWIAIGDGAFAPDPLSGLGCEFAIESGISAAHALLANNRDAALAHFEEEIRGFVDVHERRASKYYAVA